MRRLFPNFTEINYGPGLEERTIYTDHELLTQLRAGRSAAFRSLMHLYYPVLFQFAGKFVNDTALAEDIAGEAFIQLWQRHTTFESLPAVRKFLFVTAHHDCLDAIRKKGREQKKIAGLAMELPVETDDYVLQQIIRSEVMADIYRAIELLPEKMKLVFKLSYLDGLKNEEIAARLQLSNQTIRNQKSRALEILRVHFKDKDMVLSLIALLIARA